MALSQYVASKITFPCTREKKAMVKKWQLLTKSVHVDLSTSMIGLQTGHQNNLTVIDLDCKVSNTSGLKWFERMQKSFDPVNPTAMYLKPRKLQTPCVQTPSKGLHYYFLYEPLIHTSSKCIEVHTDDNKIKVDVDIRNDGGYVIAPPSENYQFIKSTDDWEKIPSWFIAAVRQGISYNKETKCCTLRACIPKQLSEDIPMKDKPTNFDYVEQLLNGINKRRADIYDDWVRVLLALGSMSQPETENSLLQLGINWSKQSSKFKSDDEVGKVFRSSNGKVTAKTLWWFLKSDNPPEFKRLRQENTKFILKSMGENFVYRNYFDICCKQNETKTVDLDVIDAYISSVFVMVLSDERMRFFARFARHETYDEWKEMSSKPMSGIEWSFELPSKDNETPTRCSIYERIMHLCLRKKIPVFDSIDYIPTNEKPMNDVSGPVFNLFKGFPFKKIVLTPTELEEAKLKIQLIRRHIKTVLCCDDAGEFAYLEWWIGHLLQHPAQKPNSILVALGKQGIGKDAIFNDFMRRLIGEWNHLVLDDIDALIGNFNKQLEGKLLIYISELKEGYGSAKGMAKLKAHITNKKLIIEPKGVDAYVVPDYARFVASGNHRNSFCLTMDDRRFFVMKNFCEPYSKEYFITLFKDIENPEIIKSAFNYYSNIDLTSMGFIPSVVPMTKFKRIMQINSLPNPQRYLYENLTLGKYHIDDLYIKYKYWANIFGETQISNAKNFRIHAEELGLKIGRITINNVRKMGFEFTVEDKKNFDLYIEEIGEKNDAELAE